MAALTRINAKYLKYINFPKFNYYRLISTSGNKRETTVIDVKQVRSVPKEETNKNWVSFGFEQHDEKEDRQSMNIIMFTSITIALVGSSFFLAYYPDFQMADWSHREGFLQLRHRESNNLPLVDANLIPIEKINLPSDEELGDTEIII